jgi:hypothetical protein
MTPDVSAAVTAIATGVLALAAIPAFIFALLAWPDQRCQLAAQGEQLELARQDSRRLRTPVLHAEVDSVGLGVPNFRLDVRLVSAEPLGHLQVTIAEARGNDCPLGFTPGQTGVEQYPDQDSLAPEWRMDVLRDEATSDELLPGSAATWQMAFREQLRHRHVGPEAIRLRAECTPMGGGDSWGIPVPVTVTDQAARELRQLGGPDIMKTVQGPGEELP